MAKHERIPPPETSQPVVPSDIYWVKVFKLVPNTNQEWTIEIDERTSAQSPHGAMRGIIDAETAKQMLELQRAVDDA
jgi:hypothetical protein